MIGEIKSPIEENPFQQYIHVSKYSRWLEDEKRRETWEETVRRYVNHLRWHFKNNLNYKPANGVFEDIFQAIYNGEVMPSMRAMMTAGKALQRSGIAAYNCAYAPIDDPRAFDEILYILAHGSGVGFSVERQYTEMLPEVPRSFEKGQEIIVVGDSKEGWAESYRELISCLYEGIIPDWDVSEVREKGSPLKTFGGYASGPEPLVELFGFIIDTFLSAQGRKLEPIEVFDIVCMTGRAIVSGGVRRSALWCGSDLDDQDMARAKHGNFREHSPWRDMANISAVYDGRPGVSKFLEEWKHLHDSYSGERGIFNRKAAQDQAKKWGKRIWDIPFGTNPCGEIFLRPQGFCNLTEVVVREEDTLGDLIRKVKIASMLGTFQSTITNFPYLRDVWKKNAEEERLLGVSLTGVFGNEIFSKDHHYRDALTLLSGEARFENKKWAGRLEINESAAITCVKPSGTVSLLNGVSAGIHPWYSEYYIRTVRGNNVEPMTQYMKDAGIPNEPCVSNPDNVTIFSFPMKAPDNARTREDFTAIKQLEDWKRFRQSWCEHNPSITVQIRDDEWLEVADWVYKNFNDIGGIAFLPYDNGNYVQAPYQECSKEEYKQLLEAMPDLDWTDLKYYERYDSLDNSKELACAGNACEIVDIGSV